jgi:hypothetical protein
MYRVGHITAEIAARMLTERVPPRSGVLDCDDEENWKTCVATQFYRWLAAAAQEQKAIVTFFL